MNVSFQSYMRYAISFGMLLLPIAALAQSFTVVLNQLETNFNLIIVFLMLLATVLFLYGVVKYIAAGGDEDAIKTGRTFMIYGIIGLAVMVAVWGFVNVLLTFIFLDSNSPAIPPGPTQL